MSREHPVEHADTTKVLQLNRAKDAWRIARDTLTSDLREWFADVNQEGFGVFAGSEGKAFVNLAQNRKSEFPDKLGWLPISNPAIWKMLTDILLRAIDGHGVKFWIATEPRATEYKVFKLDLQQIIYFAFEQHLLFQGKKRKRGEFIPNDDTALINRMKIRIPHQ